jgi:excisionase family DNA binding protein
VTPQSTPLLAAVLAELDQADDHVKRELANHLRPYLADPERLVDASEKAEQLGLHPDTLVRMAREGRIWAKKVGREWRFRPDCSDIGPLLGRSTTTPVAMDIPPQGTRTAGRGSLAAIRGRK